MYLKHNWFSFSPLGSVGNLAVHTMDCQYCLKEINSGFPQALEIMENLEITKKKVPCMKKSWNLKKKLNNHGKIMEFCELAVRHTKVVCLTASFLATGGFKF